MRWHLRILLLLLLSEECTGSLGGVALGGWGSYWIRSSGSLDINLLCVTEVWTMISMSGYHIGCSIIVLQLRRRLHRRGWCWNRCYFLYLLSLCFTDLLAFLWLLHRVVEEWLRSGRLLLLNVRNLVEAFWRVSYPEILNLSLLNKTWTILVMPHLDLLAYHCSMLSSVISALIPMIFIAVLTLSMMTGILSSWSTDLYTGCYRLVWLGRPSCSIVGIWYLLQVILCLGIILSRWGGRNSLWVISFVWM